MQTTVIVIPKSRLRDRGTLRCDWICIAVGGIELSTRAC